jgi:hypothetical protein
MHRCEYLTHLVLLLHKGLAGAAGRGAVRVRCAVLSPAQVTAPAQSYQPTFRMSRDAFSAVKAAVTCMVRAVGVAAAVAGSTSSSPQCQGVCQGTTTAAG